MFIDETEVILKAGHGGPGKVSFFKKPKGGPDGGNGGRGGDVYITGTSDLTALRQFTAVKTLSAEDGEPGGSNRKSGKGGKDLEILMPVGTLLEDIEIGKIYEVTQPGEKQLVCKGGLGGRGNFELRSPRNTTPLKAQPGLPGEIKGFKVNLKLIADFGLIGPPNAGKSSLLNALTKANAKTADYPFTTLEPNLGVFQKKIIADIPGLIEGASRGKGLGLKFLKHIEKVKMVLHCIPANSADVLSGYKTVREELKKYSGQILTKKETIVLTKSDTVDPKTLRSQIQKLKPAKRKVIAASIYDTKSLEELEKVLKDAS